MKNCIEHATFERASFIATYLASRARANTPAASGAAAEVPEWVRVHFPYKSVVALLQKKVSLKCMQYSKTLVQSPD